MFQGAITALITPFNEKGDVDYDALKSLIQWQIEEGVDGLVLCGSTGEGTSLTREEKCEIFRLGVEISSKKVPIIAATGTNTTKESAVLTSEAKKIGVDGCIAIVPYYNRPTEEGCYRHFAEITNVGLPTILYHHPGRTGIKLSVETIERICKLENVVGIKDASADLNFAMNVMQATGVVFFSGDDGLALPLFSIGAKGSISIASNVIPSHWKHFVKLALQSKRAEAREKFLELQPLVEAMVLEVNPQCVKYAMSELGKCLPMMRLPLIPPTSEHKATIRQCLLTAGSALR